MKKFSRLLRMAVIIFFMLAASFAAGVTGHFLPTTRERYHDKKITREQIDRKEDEDEDERKDEIKQ